MKNKRANKAVSSIVGTALLLGMAIALFSIVQILALSFPYNPNPPSVRLVGTIDGDTIHVFHHGGESLSLDTKIIFTIDNDISITKTAGEGDLIHSDSGDPKLWDIGENIEFNPDGFEDLSNVPVQIIIVDVESNTIVMQSTIQE